MSKFRKRKKEKEILTLSANKLKMDAVDAI